MPPTYLLGSILIMVVLHLLLPVRKVIGPPYIYVGVPLIFIGLLVNIWSSNLFNKLRTTVKPFERSVCLITEGPYRFSRHPMYLGMALGLIGLAVLLGTAIAPLVIPAFVWVFTNKFIKVEEEAMEETFGEAYRDYKKRVRRWI